MFRRSQSALTALAASTKTEAIFHIVDPPLLRNLNSHLKWAATESQLVLLVMVQFQFSVVVSGL